MDVKNTPRKGLPCKVGCGYDTGFAFLEHLYLEVPEYLFLVFAQYLGNQRYPDSPRTSPRNTPIFSQMSTKVQSKHDTDEHHTRTFLSDDNTIDCAAADFTFTICCRYVRPTHVWLSDRLSWIFPRQYRIRLLRTCHSLWRIQRQLSMWALQTKHNHHIPNIYTNVHCIWLTDCCYLQRISYEAS